MLVDLFYGIADVVDVCPPPQENVSGKPDHFFFAQAFGYRAGVLFLPLTKALRAVDTLERSGVHYGINEGLLFG